MGLFDGLEAVGLGDLKGVRLFAPASDGGSAAAGKPGSPAPAEDPMSFLYLKDFECAVCGASFTNHIVRRSKLRLLNLESDLKPNYRSIDAARYDIILCERCGYAATLSSFKQVTDKQADKILREIAPRFTARAYPAPLSLENAIERYKLALLTAVAKDAKPGEKAFLCLKTAWFYRDLGDKENETLFLRNAYAGLKLAFEGDMLPIGSTDANTTQYLLAEIARRTGEPAEALRWASSLIVKRDLPKNLRDRTLAVKEAVRAARPEG